MTSKRGLATIAGVWFCSAAVGCGDDKNGGVGVDDARRLALRLSRRDVLQRGDGRRFVSVQTRAEEVWNRDRRDDGDDRNHDHQFDERKALFPLRHLVLHGNRFVGHSPNGLLFVSITQLMSPRSTPNGRCLRADEKLVTVVMIDG